MSHAYLKSLYSICKVLYILYLYTKTWRIHEIWVEMWPCGHMQYTTVGGCSQSAGLLEPLSLTLCPGEAKLIQQHRITWMQHLQTGMERFTISNPLGSTVSACVCTQCTHLYAHLNFHLAHVATLLKRIFKIFPQTITKFAEKSLLLVREFYFLCFNVSCAFIFLQLTLVFLFFKITTVKFALCTMFTAVYTAGFFSFY